MQSQLKWFKWAHKEISLTVSPTMQGNTYPKLTVLGTIAALYFLVSPTTVPSDNKKEKNWSCLNSERRLTGLIKSYMNTFF